MEQESTSYDKSLQCTAISISVVGSKVPAYATRPNGSVGRSRGLLHVLNTNMIFVFVRFPFSSNMCTQSIFKYLKATKNLRGIFQLKLSNGESKLRENDS